MELLRARKYGSIWQYHFESAKVDGKRKTITKGGRKKKNLNGGIAHPFTNFYF